MPALRLLQAAALTLLAVAGLSSQAHGVTVYADSYGYDPNDATSALQSAINSGADTVIVPNMGTPWLVRPISLASNQHIIFNDGAEIVAKPGAFPNASDKLFTANQKQNITLDGYGATFRMQKAEYTSGEGRHGIGVYSSSNVNILGLTIRDTGGDGIYLGKQGTTAYNSNIHVKDVVSDNNRRQGMSIISVDGLLVENCRFQNTNGTAPQAGMDFEPNGATQRLANIDVRNVQISGNNGWGILVWAYYMNNTSQPISMTITNSTIVADGFGVYDRSTSDPPRSNAPTGLITLRGVSITGPYSIQSDMQIVVDQVHTADADDNGAVDVADLGVLGANYGGTGKTWGQGDFSGDGKVDVIDLGVLGANYGWQAPAPGAATVPEPASLALLAFGGLAMLRRRTRP